MSIRRLLYTMLLTLTALAVGLGAREYLDLQNKNASLAWLQQTNRIAQQAQELGGQLARERGLSIVMLADTAPPEPNVTMLLNRTRTRVDNGYAALMAKVADINANATTRMPASLLRRLADQRDTLDQIRASADARVAASPNTFASMKSWVERLTPLFTTLQHVLDLNTATPGPSLKLDVQASQPLIKGVLFSFNEMLGRERALIAAVLASGEGLAERHARRLDQLRANILQTWSRTDTLLQTAATSADVQLVAQDFWRELLLHHESPRQRILEQLEYGQPVTMSAMQWFERSSTGINAALTLSTRLSERIADDLARSQAQVDRRLVLFTAVLPLTLALLWLMYWTLQRRILHPLRTLEQAAMSISTGNLAPNLPHARPDELGRLTSAFAHMSASLRHSERGRSAALAEMRKLNTAIEQSVSSVIMTDAKGFIEYTNPQFTRTTGYTEQEVRGRHVSILKSGHTPAEHYSGLWETLQAARAWKGELLNKRKNGQLYWEAVSISPICNAVGQITHFISIQHDIDEEKRVRERLRFISSYDSLTHLPNRSLLIERFEQARRSDRDNGTQTAVVMLGVRRFKRINDSLGHEVGDQLLRELAARITHCLNEHDTASRSTGSEFAVLLTGLRPSDAIIDRVKQLQEHVGRPAHINHHHLQLSVHAGISLMPGDGDNFDQLLAYAGMALHEAERENTASLLFYTRSLSIDVQENMQLENALRHALGDNQLCLHYQPKVDLRSGRIIGAEALARWWHPATGQYVSPDYFIAVAEETGLIHTLGNWVLDESCAQMARWREQGLPPIRVAINLSAMQLKDNDLPDSIAQTLQRHAIEGEMLEIELTESTVMENPEEATVALRLLKSLGLRITIDDFGTGYSSFAYLNRFPVDVLKVDRTFIDGLQRDHSAAAIVSSVIALAHRIGLRVVAEGVETRAQLDWLYQQECDEIQGYYFSKPVPASEFAELLHTGKALPTPMQQA